MDEILKSHGLISHTIKDNRSTEYEFEDKYINNRKRNVATDIRPLLNGGVSGYLYVEHLKEYDNNPNKTKKGHMKITDMTEDEFITLLEKVIKDYI